MARPVKGRQIAVIPSVTYFKPVGIPSECTDVVLLSLEETEAIRLKDIEGLEQSQGAGRMMVSRPTFQRVLTSARRKTADALLNGKAIRINGGHFEVAPAQFRCSNGHEWDVPFESMITDPPTKCPICSTPVLEQLTLKMGDCPLKKRLASCRGCSRNNGNSKILAGLNV